MEHMIAGISNRNTNGVAGTIVFETDAAFIFSGLASPKGSLLLHLEPSTSAAGTGRAFQIATGVPAFNGATGL